jgi:hypothetical protein
VSARVSPANCDWLCASEKEAEPISHTVKPLNSGTSTHRWARAAEGAHGDAAQRLPVLLQILRRQENRERRTQVWALGFPQQTMTGFVRPGSKGIRRLTMNGPR